MEDEKKSLLIKYIVCFCVASLITFIVFWIKGFFTENPAVNMQILSDGFSISGLLMTMFAGMIYISGEGALIGLGFVLRNVVLTFIPMGRNRHETYKQYRERKIGNVKKASDKCMLLVGLLFLAVGVVLTIVWDVKYYPA